MARIGGNQTPRVPLLAFHRIASGEAFGVGGMVDVELTPAGDAITSSVPGKGTWTGLWVRPGFAFEEVVPSWNADTPAGSLVEIGLQARATDGLESGWYVLGRWTLDDAAFRRTSVAGQADELGAVDTDTFRAAAPLDAYRLRLTLSTAGRAAPTVRLVAAIASATTRSGEPASTPGNGVGIELSVPQYSQSIHAGEYPEYDSGGASWCSPTSTAMVIAHWGTGPTPADYAWVRPEYADPFVDHAARFTYDHGYAGAGNWSFNTAYAAQFGLDAFVTRLRSLREAEAFLKAGIPLVASISAGPGELDGFQLPQGTAGHLVVIVGFTPEGDPIVNDPAAVSNAAVRRTYDRAQFERAWLGGSGGVVYVIRPPGVPLPPSEGNW